jgi:tetratricopeptide (TPR) repeat protein
MTPHRDDLISRGGLVEKGIYEALLLCEYAIADLTTSNPNVLYELGVRHAVRPSSTLTITARPDAIPFDARNLRTVRYTLDRRNRLNEESAQALGRALDRELAELRRDVSDVPEFTDSPLFQLIEGWRPIQPDSLKTDLFARRVKYNDDFKRQLAKLRLRGSRGGAGLAQALAETRALHQSIGALDGIETGVLVDLLLTYRALEDWDAMIELVADMPGYIALRALVQEQLAFALNRRATRDHDEHDRDDALAALRELHVQSRSTSETFGLIGRIFKDRWRQASASDDKAEMLDQAIEAYGQGFRMDPRDPYPGINWVSLRWIRGADDEDEPLGSSIAVVEFAVQRLMSIDEPTYWLHATLVELAVMRQDPTTAKAQLRRAMSRIGEVWEPETSADNLRDLAEAHASRGQDAEWIHDMEAKLRSHRGTT